jgi:hypothetical protein
MGQSIAITDGMRAAVRAILEENPRHGKGVVHERTGYSIDTCSKILHEIKPEFAEPAADAKDELSQCVFDNKKGMITVRNKQVRSLDEALEFFAVDLNTWRVQKHVVNQWGKGDMLQVKVWLERKLPAVVEDAMMELIERTIVERPGTARIYMEPTSEGHMLILSPVDHHFGKLAWGEETGENYDLAEAEQLYVRAVDEAIEWAGGKQIEEIHIPVGSDLFHFDSSRGQTANGTQMDVDSRPQKVFVSASIAVAAAIERAASLAPVKVHFVPGNHDPTWSHHLCVFLRGYFRNDDRITVDLGPMARKYIEYGSNMVMMTHGDLSQVNIKMLPVQMAASRPEMWGRTRNWEVLMGHTHHQKETHFVPMEENSGVMVRVLPSLCGTDEWHFTKGYIGNRRAMLSLVYSKAKGYVGQHICYAKDLS